MKLNTPNKLTLLRMALVPFFVAFLLIEAIPHRHLFAAAFFGIASFTDFLDGYLARRDGLVTNFGKFLDPLADKLLVIAAFMCFVDLEYISSAVVIITIAREFAVTSIRLVAGNSGVVIAADMWGKIKTVSQIVAILAIMLLQEAVELFPALFQNVPVFWICEGLMWVTAVATIMSGARYLINGWKYIQE